MNDRPAITPDVPSEPPRHRAVTALRYALEASDPGTLAALRRADPASPPAAFYRVTVSILDDHLPASGAQRDALEGRWLIVVSAMASAIGTLGGTPLGEALAKADVSEMRIMRLLEASGAQIADLARHAVHQLVQRAQPFNPNDLADLVLTADTDRRQEPRRRIARSFYRHQSA